MTMNQTEEQEMMARTAMFMFLRGYVGKQRAVDIERLEIEMEIERIHGNHKVQEFAEVMSI